MNQKLISLIRKQMNNRPNSIAMKIKQNNEEISLTWSDIRKKSEMISSYLVKNTSIQDNIAIFSQNKPEWSIVDFACLQTNNCIVPIYPTTIDEHLIHIINNAEIKIAFVGSKEQYNTLNNIKQHCSTLKDIILMVNHEVENTKTLYEIYEKENTTENISSINTIIEERISHIERTDLVSILYTSGTTGMPKGVMLNNENFSAAIDAHLERIKIDETDTSLCFLPLSHIFERAWSYYVLVCGGVNYYLENPQLISKAIKQIKPTVMCSVPRFFEKVYSSIQSDLDTASSSKKNLFKWATRIGRKVFTRKSNNEFISPTLLLQYWIADKLVYSKFKNAFGGRVRFFNCGGAGLQDDVNIFFQSLRVPIIYGYGATETLATVSCYTKIPAIGSVGKPMSGIEVKIGENNEILVRGKTVTQGYYKLPEENKIAFENGWFKTGDAGRLDIEGNLYYIERIKDLMKTSNGKYVAPQTVEGTLLKDKFVDQVAVIAEGKSFVSALIVPNYEELQKYAKEKLIAFENNSDLMKHHHIISMLEERVKKIQESLNNFERVKKFKLLEKPFSIQANEITPTLKLKRKVIMEKYHHLIEELYNKKQRKKQDDINNKEKNDK